MSIGEAGNSQGPQRPRQQGPNQTQRLIFGAAAFAARAPVVHGQDQADTDRFPEGAEVTCQHIVEGVNVETLDGGDKVDTFNTEMWETVDDGTLHTVVDGTVGDASGAYLTQNWRTDAGVHWTTQSTGPITQQEFYQILEDQDFNCFVTNDGELALRADFEDLQRQFVEFMRELDQEGGVANTTDTGDTGDQISNATHWNVVAYVALAIGGVILLKFLCNLFKAYQARDDESFQELCGKVLRTMFSCHKEGTGVNQGGQVDQVDVETGNLAAPPRIGQTGNQTYRAAVQPQRSQTSTDSGVYGDGHAPAPPIGASADGNSVSQTGSVAVSGDGHASDAPQTHSLPATPPSSTSPTNSDRSDDGSAGRKAGLKNSEISFLHEKIRDGSLTFAILSESSDDPNVALRTWLTQNNDDYVDYCKDHQDLDRDPDDISELSLLIMNDLKQLEDTQSLQSELTEIKAQLDQVNADIAEIKGKMTVVVYRDDVGQLEALQEDLLEIKSDLEREISETREDTQKLQQELDDIKKQLSQVEAELDQAQLKAVKRELLEIKSELEGKIEEKNQRVSSFEETQKELRQELREKMDQLEKMQVEIQDAHDLAKGKASLEQVNEFGDKVTQLESKISELAYIDSVDGVVDELGEAKDPKTYKAKINSLCEDHPKFAEKIKANSNIKWHEDMDAQAVFDKKTQIDAVFLEYDDSLAVSREDFKKLKAQHAEFFEALKLNVANLESSISEQKVANEAKLAEIEAELARFDGIEEQKAQIQSCIKRLNETATDIKALRTEMSDEVEHFSNLIDAQLEELRTAGDKDRRSIKASIRELETKLEEHKDFYTTQEAQIETALKEELETALETMAKNQQSFEGLSNHCESLTEALILISRTVDSHSDDLKTLTTQFSSVRSILAQLDNETEIAREELDIAIQERAELNAADEKLKSILRAAREARGRGASHPHDFIPPGAPPRRKPVPPTKPRQGDGQVPKTSTPTVHSRDRRRKTSWVTQNLHDGNPT